MNDVTHSVTDGLLGYGIVSGTGVHIKIGASPITAAEPVVITSSRNLDYIHEHLGLSPLADAVMDSVENGSSKILCIPVTPGTEGTITVVKEATKTSTSGTITMTGKPNNKFSIIILITGKGVLNTAAFKYSINGGYTYSDELSVPLSGAYEIPGTGLTATFAVSEAQEFAVNDTFKWETTAPQLANENVIAGCNKIKNIKQETEFVHIVGSCTADTWVAVSAIQKELHKNHKPLMFIMEAYEKEASETLKQYQDSLEASRKKVKNFCIQVVAARAMYKGMDNLTRNINFAGIICGLYAKVSVNKSIGETAAISITEDKVLKLLPDGIEDEMIDVLDQMGYLTMRQYDGLLGYYVNNARVMGPEGTDYKYAEDVRVVNKIIRKTRKEALLQLQSDIDLENPMADLQAKAQFIQAPLDTMVTDKEISSAEIIIPEDVAEKILTTETLALQIRYVQRGIIRNIIIDVGKKNPYAS